MSELPPPDLMDHGGRARDEILVRLRSRRRDEEQQHVGRGLLEVFVEHFASRLSQGAHVANDDDTPLGHHRRRAHDRAERLRVDLGAAQELEVEVAGGRVDRGADDPADLFLFHVVVVAVEIVDGREGSVFDRGSDGFGVDER